MQSRSYNTNFFCSSQSVSFIFVVTFYSTDFTQHFLYNSLSLRRGCKAVHGSRQGVDGCVGVLPSPSRQGVDGCCPLPGHARSRVQNSWPLGTQLQFLQSACVLHRHTCNITHILHDCVLHTLFGCKMRAALLCMCSTHVALIRGLVRKEHNTKAKIIDLGLVTRPWRDCMALHM